MFHDLLCIHNVDTKKGMEDRKKPYLPGESIAIVMSAAMNEVFRVGLCGE